MSTFTDFLNLELPGHGEYVNTWEIPANTNFTAIDALFDGDPSSGLGTGHIHDGTAGQGPQIDHDDLLNNGTTSHADIDTHIANTGIHFAASAMVLAIEEDPPGAAFPTGSWNNGPGGVDLITTLKIKGARSITSPSTGVVLVDVSPVSGPTGPATGVPSHLPPTSAPVAVTDFFATQPLSPLSSSNWFVQAPQLVELLMSQQGARLSQDTSQGGVAAGTIVNRVKAQVPHSEVQRVTLHLCRVGVDGFVNNTNRFMLQIALMSSVFSSVNLPSRLGFFFRIEVYKTGGVIYMDRTLFAVPTVSVNGLSQVTTLWADTGPVTNSRHYQGTHEFSLDRTHAFFYAYNNGPVNLSTAGNVGAATPFVANLKNSLSLEPSQLAAGLLSPATQPGVAPNYGRFGFDVSWTIGDGSSAANPGTVDATIEYFTATSVDDERVVYTAVIPQDDCDAIEPTQPHDPCCPGTTTPAVYDLLTVAVPGLGS